MGEAYLFGNGGVGDSLKKLMLLLRFVIPLVQFVLVHKKVKSC